MIGKLVYCMETSRMAHARNDTPLFATGLVEFFRVGD